MRALEKIMFEGLRMPGAMCGHWGVCGSISSLGAALSIINNTDFKIPDQIIETDKYKILTDNHASNPENKQIYLPEKEKCFELETSIQSDCNNCLKINLHVFSFNFVLFLTKVNKSPPETFSITINI